MRSISTIVVIFSLCNKCLFEHHGNYSDIVRIIVFQRNRVFHSVVLLIVLSKIRVWVSVMTWFLASLRVFISKNNGRWHISVQPFMRTLKGSFHGGVSSLGCCRSLPHFLLTFCHAPLSFCHAIIALFFHFLSTVIVEILPCINSAHSCSRTSGIGAFGIHK